MYFVEYDGQHRGTDNEIYYTYTTLDGTAEKDVVADSKVAGSSNIYAAYYKTRTNGDGQLTNVTAVPARDGKYFSSGFTSGKENICTAPITYSDGALTLGGTGYTMADKYTITLVTVGEDLDGNGKTAADLNKDKKADYEVSTVTAKELADTLKGYAISYTFQGKTTDTNGSVIEELYVTVKEATATTTPGGGSGVIGTNDSGDEAKWVNSKVELFYYGSPMTTDEIRTAIGNLFGYEVTNYNGVLGSATLSTGDVVSVNTTQHQQFAVKVEGTTVDFVTATDVASLGTDKTDKVPAGTYLKEKDAPTNNPITVSSRTPYAPNATTDINLIPAYKVTLNSVATAGTVSDGNYVQKGTEITLTFATAGYYKIENGTAANTVKVEASGTQKVTVAGAVTVTELKNYASADDMTTAIKTGLTNAGYTEGTPKSVTNGTVTWNGTTISIEVANGSTIDKVSGTGLVTLARTMIASGNTGKLTFADGTVVNLNANNIASAKDLLTGALATNTLPTSVTVVATNTASGASVTYTVAISQATA